MDRTARAGQPGQVGRTGQPGQLGSTDPPDDASLDKAARKGWPEHDSKDRGTGQLW